MSKLNLVRPQGVIITLGEKEYDIVYNFNAFAELEKEFGTIQEAFNRMGNEPKVCDILKILRAGMSSNEEVPSEKELGIYLTLVNLPQVMSIIQEALNVAMPQETEVKEKNKKAANQKN